MQCNTCGLVSDGTLNLQFDRVEFITSGLKTYFCRVCFENLHCMRYSPEEIGAITLNWIIPVEQIARGRRYRKPRPKLTELQATKEVAIEAAVQDFKMFTGRPPVRTKYVKADRYM